MNEEGSRVVANDSASATVGVIKGIAQRAEKGDPMVEVDHGHVSLNVGLDAEHRPPGKRSVTLLSDSRWSQACTELGVTLPWTTRRANFLISGLDLSTLIGRAILIGTVRVWIHAETKPCALMDEQHSGLRAALKPNFRGGVYGQVLTEGTISISDRVVFAPDK